MFRQPTRTIYIPLVAVLVALCACQPLSPPEATPASAQFSLVPSSGEHERVATEIFADVSPAVAFVETPAGTGSGVLLEHNYLLTNAHVIWPFQEVRVVFPDGSEHLDTPIHTWDLMADLALVGPIETEVESVSLVDGSDLEIGEDVYLIGYPAEVEEFPQPAITNGILSRLRTWDAIDLSFFQVDATTTGGQSGGIMVTHGGDVVGISTFYYSGFGLASSVADALPRLNAMLGNETGAILSDRPFAQDNAQRQHRAMLDGDLTGHSYVLREPVNTEVEVAVEGVGHPQIIVRDLYGSHIAETEGPDPERQDATVKFAVDEELPYIIYVEQYSVNENEYTLMSSHPLAAYQDPDDNQLLAFGETVIASMDTVDDIDIFELALEAGDAVEITVDALSIDPFIYLWHETPSRSQAVGDDDGGGGIFGESARLVYEAPEDGLYQFLVSNVNFDSNVGSYFVSVAAADEDAELTELDVDATLVATDFGPMSWYESEANGFSMLYPADWEEVSAEECASYGGSSCYVSEAGILILVEESLSALPKKERNRERYVALSQEILELEPSIDVISSAPITTLQRLQADRLNYEAQAGLVKGTLLIYVDEVEEVAFNASIVSSTEDYDRLELMIDFLLESFRRWDVEDRDSDAAHHLDEGDRLASDEDDAGAVEAYSRSIELNPVLTPAYARRAQALYRLDQPEDALTDLGKAIEMAPEDADLHRSRATLYWQEGAHAEALADITRAIELDPERLIDYNLRSLINAFIGDYDAAFSDVDKTIALNDDELRPSVQDSRGFIYIKIGDFESAKSDYDAVFDKDMRNPHALLGAGIAYAELGEAEEARALIEEGLEQVQEEAIDHPDPQLADLLKMAEQTMSALESGE